MEHAICPSKRRSLKKCPYRQPKKLEIEINDILDRRKAIQKKHKRILIIIRAWTRYPFHN